MVEMAIPHPIKKYLEMAPENLEAVLMEYPFYHFPRVAQILDRNKLAGQDLDSLNYFGFEKSKLSDYAKAYAHLDLMAVLEDVEDSNELIVEDSAPDLNEIQISISEVVNTENIENEIRIEKESIIQDESTAYATEIQQLEGDNKYDTDDLMNNTDTLLDFTERIREVEISNGNVGSIEFIHSEENFDKEAEQDDAFDVVPANNELQEDIESNDDSENQIVNVMDILLRDAKHKQEDKSIEIGSILNMPNDGESNKIEFQSTNQEILESNNFSFDFLDSGEGKNDSFNFNFEFIEKDLSEHREKTDKSDIETREIEAENFEDEENSNLVEESKLDSFSLTLGEDKILGNQTVEEEISSKFLEIEDQSSFSAQLVRNENSENNLNSETQESQDFASWLNQFSSAAQPLQKIETKNIAPIPAEKLNPAEDKISEFSIKPSINISEESRLNLAKDEELEGVLRDNFFLEQIESKKGTRKEPVENRIQDESKQSLTSLDLVTEPIAILYAQQGNLAKAIEIYTKLIEVFPEKSSFFATQIEKLRK